MSVVLLSGGVDSLVCLNRERANDPLCLFVDYGQESGEAEQHSARSIASRFAVPLTEARATLWPAVIPGTSTAYVPARNTVLIALAAALAEQTGRSRVVYGANAGDAEGFPDCRPAYVDAINETLRRGLGTPITVSAPLVHMTKRDVILEARLHALPLSLTVSCYHQEAGGGEPCGRCESCLTITEAGGW